MAFVTFWRRGAVAAHYGRAPRRAIDHWRGGPQAALLGASQRRLIRTGFFPEDPDYLDPEAPLLAVHMDERWRLMDDPSLQAPVLERSNVGMGMLVLNRGAAGGMDLPAINELYRRLRNLEVNSLKRFVGLSAREPAPFCTGADARELLLAATVAARQESLPPFSRALLWHHQELAHLVGSYRKPIVCYMSGLATNGGAALACLASFSGAYRDSELRVDACFMGLVPDGGMSHVLARLKWNIGEFLALTGWSVRGPDLIYTGLVKHWLSPEALPLLELTAEKQLEVSETDAGRLLHEHSLPLPPPPHGFADGCSVPRAVVPCVSQAFGKESIGKIVESLKNFATGYGLKLALKQWETGAGKRVGTGTTEPGWARAAELFEAFNTLGAGWLAPPDVQQSERWRSAGVAAEGGDCWFMPPIADRVRQELRGIYREYAAEQPVPGAEIALRAVTDAFVQVFFAQECLQRLQRASPMALHATLGLIREAKKGLKDATRPPEANLETALRLELRVQQRLLREHDAVVGLHAHCLGRELRAEDWSRKGIQDVVEEEVPILMGRVPGADFVVQERADMPLSQHPRLRRYHPDYDERTGMDHDPAWMRSEVRRWSPDLFKEQRETAIRELLSMQGGSMTSHGIARFVHVDSAR